MGIMDGLEYSPHGDNETAITFTEGEFSGIKFKFGRVWFEDENNPALSYEYDILSEKKPEHVMKFEYTIGEILHKMLQKALEEQTAIYTGGV